MTGLTIASCSAQDASTTAKAAVVSDLVEDRMTEPEDSPPAPVTPDGLADTDLAPTRTVDANVEPNLWQDDPLLPLRTRYVSQQRVPIPTMADTDGKMTVPYVVPHATHFYGAQLRVALGFQNQNQPNITLLVSISPQGVATVHANLDNLYKVKPKPIQQDAPEFMSRSLQVVGLTSLANGNWLALATGISDAVFAYTHLQLVEIDNSGALVKAVVVKTPPWPPDSAELAKKKGWAAAGEPIFRPPAFLAVWHPDSKAFIYRFDMFGPWAALRIDADGVATLLHWQFQPVPIAIDDGKGSDPAAFNPLLAWHHDLYYVAPTTSYKSQAMNHLAVIGSSLHELNSWYAHSVAPFGWAISRLDLADPKVKWLSASTMEHLDPENEGNIADTFGTPWTSEPFSTRHVGAAVALAAAGVANGADKGAASGADGEVLVEFQRNTTILRSPSTGEPLGFLPRPVVPHQGVWPDSSCTAMPTGIVCIGSRAEFYGPPCVAGPECEKPNLCNWLACYAKFASAKYPGELVVTISQVETGQGQ